MSDIRSQIILAARQCIGTPFRHQGRWPGRGLDCVGLVRYPAVALGLYNDDADVFGYREIPDPERMERELENWFEPIDKSAIAPADILWLRAPQPQHLAIYTGSTIIHAMSTGPGRVVEHGYRHPFPSKLIRAFRYRGVD